MDSYFFDVFSVKKVVVFNPNMWHFNERFKLTQVFQLSGWFDGKYWCHKNQVENATGESRECIGDGLD